MKRSEQKKLWNFQLKGLKGIGHVFIINSSTTHHNLLMGMNRQPALKIGKLLVQVKHRKYCFKGDLFSHFYINRSLFH